MFTEEIISKKEQAKLEQLKKGTGQVGNSKKEQAVGEDIDERGKKGTGYA